MSDSKRKKSRKAIAEEEEMMRLLPSHLQDLSPAWKKWFIEIRKQLDQGREENGK